MNLIEEDGLKILIFSVANAGKDINVASIIKNCFMIFPMCCLNAKYLANEFMDRSPS
jgi:hypothetical protein